MAMRGGNNGTDGRRGNGNTRANGKGNTNGNGRRRNGADPVINLALQGGGSHGAFTWGVLDALLDDGRLSFEGITGASAGAMNAVVLAEGWRRGLDAGTDPRAAACRRRCRGSRRPTARSRRR